LNETASKHNLYTIAFYNLENLFDTAENPKILDKDFTPEGRNKWNTKRYQKKLKRLSNVIAQIGEKETGFSPAVIGIAEVENREVIEDLLRTNNLREKQYSIVHFDSPDERGVDVAFLYRKNVFELLDAQPITLLVENEKGIRDLTRDILLVKGKLEGKLIYFLINHWPSRRNGDNQTEYKRIQAAQMVHEVIAKIKKETTDPAIIIMGDFNDNPTNISIQEYLVTEEFYNPYASIFNNSTGTLTYKRQWHLFDQIILSKNLVGTEDISYQNANIFNEEYLKEWKGKNKGRPYRTYIGKWHQGGYSDHFPVYVALKIIA